MDIKFCEDCKWYKQEWGTSDRCNHPEAKRTGGLLVRKEWLPNADEERLSDGNCGLEGKYWEAKDATN